MQSSESPDRKDHGVVTSRQWTRISWAWLFPVLAAGAALWLFASERKSQGPEIEIRFPEAPGIQAGKSLLIYRGVNSGIVTSVRLEKSLQEVVIKVRLKAFAAELASVGTDYWVEQPVLSLRETTGLDSIIQGNSIHARSQGGEFKTNFKGLSTAPLDPLETPALMIRLHAPEIQSLDRGTPIYYRGVSVGIVNNKDLDDQGRPYLRVIIDEKFSRMVSENSRFWIVPATSLHVDQNGASLNIAGLAALIEGGITFENFKPSSVIAKSGTDFTLYSTETAARAESRPITVAFDDGRGLVAQGTRVCYLGQPIGLVESVKPDPSSGMVVSTIRLEASFENLAASDTLFTLIRPHISLEGVSGLDTLITGAYIACEPGSGNTPADSFIGRTLSADEWNIANTNKDSLQIVLRADEIPTIGKGAPIYYRGLVAGSVTDKVLDENQLPFLRAVIAPQFRNALHSNSRFWRVPATSVAAGPGVIEMKLQGLAAFAQGGIAFDAFSQPVAPAEEGASFVLNDDERSARAISQPIHISFDNGRGLLPEKTELRYLGVPVGIVEKVVTSNDRVKVTARFEPGYEMLQREGATFAIVQPKLSLQGMTGIETLISGVYIDCTPGDGKRQAKSFTGKSIFDVALNEREGMEILVSASSSGIRPGASVVYRDLAVGEVTDKFLSKDGSKVVLKLSIDERYKNLVRENSKFWDASNTKASIGFITLRVHSQALTMLDGRIAFATPDNRNMGPAAKPGQEFELHALPRKEWHHWSPSIPER